MSKIKRSHAQKLASRRNGARSRGPLSDEARARSARNSLTHGLTANTIVLDGEHRERFQTLLDDLLADLAPQTTLEFSVVEELAAVLWKQRRAWAMEAEYFEKQENTSSEINRYCTTWNRLHKPAQAFQNLLLQQVRLHRQVDRTLRRFRELELLRLEATENKSLPEEN